MTEPLLAVEIEGKELLFMADTGAMVSLIQSTVFRAAMRAYDVQARGVTGTQLDILGEQVEFDIKSRDGYVTFGHIFIFCPLTRCRSSILGMDFLQRVGAEISLTSQELVIDQHTFQFVDQEGKTPTGPSLAREDREGTVLPTHSEVGVESVEDRVGTVELAETVSLPPLSVRIARCRVVRRDDPTDIKVPRKQLVMVDPEGLPGIYMARVVATLDNVKVSSVNTRGLGP